MLYKAVNGMFKIFSALYFVRFLSHFSSGEKQISKCIKCCIPHYFYGDSFNFMLSTPCHLTPIMLQTLKPRK